MTKLLHTDLTYAIRGVLMQVHNALGPGLPEAFYDKAASIGFHDTRLDIQPVRVAEKIRAA